MEDGCCHRQTSDFPVTSQWLANVQRCGELLSQSDAQFLCHVTVTGRRPTSKTVVVRQGRAVSLWRQSNGPTSSVEDGCCHRTTSGFSVTSDRLADVQRQLELLQSDAQFLWRGRRVLSQNDERFLWRQTDWLTSSVNKSCYRATCSFGDVRVTGRRPAWKTVVVTERWALSVWRQTDWPTSSVNKSCYRATRSFCDVRVTGGRLA